MKHFFIILTIVLFLGGLFQIGVYFGKKNAYELPKKVLFVPKKVISKNVVLTKELVYPVSTEVLQKMVSKLNAQSISPVFVANFPSDFIEKGNEDLFIQTLLPLILEENEKIAQERARLLPVAHLRMADKPLTKEQSQYLSFLITKYDVGNFSPKKQIKQLLLRVDRISPALAVAQALESTQNGKDLTSIFGISKWNKNNQFVPVIYSDLRQAVSDYALHLNSVFTYFKFWELRSLHRGSRNPLQGRVFLSGLTAYKYRDNNYLNRLDGIYTQKKLDYLDEIFLKKEI